MHATHFPLRDQSSTVLAKCYSEFCTDRRVNGLNADTLILISGLTGVGCFCVLGLTFHECNLLCQCSLQRIPRSNRITRQSAQFVSVDAMRRS